MANVPKLEIVVDDTSGVKGAVEVYYRFAGRCFDEPQKSVRV
jgi:hypothetical protein